MTHKDFRPLADMSDEVGTLTPNTEAEKVAALKAALRAATDADEAAHFRALLGLEGA